jgi:hypothetical protein
VTSRWNNPTGGLGYHLGALRRRRAWAPFARNIARWLAGWSPTETELLLVGPSGGHCLDPMFLRRFARVVAVDIDPFAPWFFRWRMRDALRGAQFEWDPRDHLSPGPHGFDVAPLRALLAAHPATAVLFCNLLGQLPLLGEDRDPAQDDDAPPAGSYEHFLRALPETLAGRSWATFHDRLSGNVAPRGLDATKPAPWCTAEELVQRHYPMTDDDGLALRDHRTSALLPEVPRWQFAWELAPGLFHLIEAMSFRGDVAEAVVPSAEDGRSHER